jgi:xanthine dehydrogenase accessory factor
LRELLPDLENWLAKGEPVALATVISTWGSAPRPAGSCMAISQSGGIAGSVSGGCVEGAVVQASKEVLASGRPQRLHFGVADETAWDVGLACGGQIDIFVQPVDKKIFGEILPRLKADQGMVLDTVITGNDADLGAQVLRDSDGKTIAATANASFPLAEIKTQPQIIQEEKGSEVFENPLPTSPTLVLVGGVHIAVALAELAHTLNFRTVIIDPRKAFGTAERFAHADKLIQAWPQAAFEQVPLNASTAIATLSHDPKIDEPALVHALRSKAFYVGALGSKRNQASRRERLAAAGLSESELARLHAPIGLAINAETPEEIALAIMAEVVAAYRSR